MENLLMF